MTTIAFSKDTLAADTKLSSDDAYWANCTKIKKVKGWLIGAAGGWDLTEAFMSRFDPSFIKMKSVLPLPQLAEKDPDFEALMISPEGKVYYTEAGGVVGVVKTKGFLAIGSGAKVAMTAMEMGATAVEAIKMAMKYDIYTGGRVQKVKLG